MRYMDTSDRNAYDRCYLNAHDRTGEIFLITGLGVYPNLGVIDAYATVGRGDRVVTVRASDALGDDRSQQSVGPYRIEVVKALHDLRVVCDGDDYGVGFDLTWHGSFLPVEEPRHVIRQGGRIIVDAQRFAQVGTWSGTLRVEGEELTVSDDRWVGTRDRSWGIRPIAEPDPPGRTAAEMAADYGFWWLYMPMRFDDFAVVIIMQEDGQGKRTLNEAVRVWPASSGRPPDQLGWPQVEVHYQSGTRHAVGATIRLTQPDGKPLEIEAETLGHVPLNCGSGYGNDPDWTHGQWRGRGWVEGAVCTLSDPAVSGRVPFAVVDHVGRATCDGVEGWGLFEHACVGAHAPSGFADFGSVAR
jgi:hypothetical protein